MDQTFQQEQQLTQQQKCSQMQMQFAKMVQLPLEQLEQRVRDELDTNAALEVKDEALDEPEKDYATSENDDEMEPTGYEDDFSYTSDAHEEALSAGASRDQLADYDSPDDIPPYLLDPRTSGLTPTTPSFPDTSLPSPSERVAQGESFYEDLLDQLQMQNAPEKVCQVARYLIGSLDDDGFLRKPLYVLQDEMEIYADIHATDEEMQAALQLVQSLEPIGIGAKNLQECLLLQLRARRDDVARRIAVLNASPSKETAAKQRERQEGEAQQAALRDAERIVSEQFECFSNHHWDVLCRRLKLSPEAFEAARAQLGRLNPSPGRAMHEAASDAAPTVRPDVFITESDDGKICVILNYGNLPKLQVSPSFLKTKSDLSARRSQGLSASDQATLTYVRELTDQAKNFITLVHRSLDTLQKVMAAVAAAQSDFFRSDDDELALRPLSTSDVAEVIGVSVSTVTRCISGKYIQTPYGIYPAQYFFSQAMTNAAAEGEEISAQQVKNLLRRLIEEEDKRHPLSDESLAARISEAGFPVARRTVAKYRDEMGIPVMRLRKE